MLILQNKIYWYKDLYPHAIASAIRKITPYKICPHVHRYSYIGTGPVRRWGTNLRHSASQFPTSLQCRLHALIMTQEGDALLSLTLLVDRTFTVLDITSIGVILEGSVMKIQRNLGDLQSKPKGITLSYHHISPAYNSGERNCRLTSFSYSSVLQRWEHPIARGDKREHWWHAGHRWWLQTHLEQVWDGFVTCFTQPVVSGWAKSRFHSQASALCSSPGDLHAGLEIWKQEKHQPLESGQEYRLMQLDKGTDPRQILFENGKATGNQLCSAAGDVMPLESKMDRQLWWILSLSQEQELRMEDITLTWEKAEQREEGTSRRGGGGAEKRQGTALSGRE